ncbi:MAG: triple tyrosine motif-containing protein [Bacteroidota bacterium]
MFNSINAGKYSLILVLLFLSCPPAKASIGKYPIKNFTPAEYGAGIQNIDFAQNRDMALFVANNLGVLSFNGSEWETHAFKTGKKKRALAFDENTDRLYVGSQGDFGYFEGDWNYVTLTDKIPKGSRGFDEVWDVFLFDSNVYFCTFQAIYVFDGESIFVIKHDRGFNRSFCISNRLFTQDPSGKLFEIKGNKLTAAFPQGQTGQIVAGIVPKDGGYLLFYNSGKVEFSTLLGVSTTYPGLMQDLNEKYVNHVLQLSDTRLVISTQVAGLYLFDMQSEVLEHITIEDGLQTNACLRTFQDQTGNLWVGMQNGIALIDINSPLRLISQKTNIQGSGYDAYETNAGTYYTTSNGIYYLKRGLFRSVFLKGTEGPAYGIQMIGNKLYAGHHTGLFLLEEGTAKRCAATDGLWQIKQLRSNPEYAVGGTYSGLHLFRFNDFQELEGVQKIKGFDESSRFFEEDRKGRIWVGQFYKGLYQLNLENELTEAVVQNVSDLYDLPIQEHIILSKIDDQLYLGTEAGVYKLDQPSDKIVKAEVFSNVIREDWVYLFTQDNQKNVFVFTDNLVGLFKQVSANNYAYVPSSLFQLRQYFNNDLLNVAKNIGDGVLFNANEGFIYYNSKLEDRLTIEKQPLISEVYNVAEDSILYARSPFERRSADIQHVSVTQGTKILKFVVESFKFKDVNNRQFRYLLKGFDEGYGDWVNTTTKEYTNLKEGEYEFYVQTLNSLGEIVTSAPLMIEVTPPFFKGVFAKVMYALLVVFGLLQTYRFQRQYYKGKEKRLEKTRQQELAQNQKELQQLKEEKIKSELRHVNNLLAASTMNLVVKNEFMENIKEELKQVRVKGEVAETRNALEKIVKEIDTTLKLQEDWKQFEYHFDHVHGDFLTRLTSEFRDLTPGEQKLCAFLRLKMDTKEISNLMSISLRGVEVARYRLRKKLGLENYQNLSKFILEY